MISHPMRAASIIHSVSRNAGGLFYTVRELNRAISRLGVDNAIFGLHDEYTDEDVHEWEPLCVHTGQLVGPRRFGYTRNLRPQIEAFSPDVVHLHGIWQYPGLTGSSWARRHKRPYIISAHGMLDTWAISNQRWKKVFAGWLFEWSNLSRASCLRALNEAELRAFRNFGLKNPVCVIPNGIVAVPPGIVPKRAGRRRILYLGRLHPKKGLPILLQAWARIKNEYTDWQLVIAGWDEGNHEDVLKQIAEELGLGGSVNFIGPCFGDKKQQVFTEAEAFVLPSMSEGLPTVVLEAWSHGLPVAMTPECNLPGGFAVGAAVCMNTTLSGVEAGLRNLFTMTPDERAAMGDRGRRFVVEHFSWEMIGADMTAVYEWLLGSESQPSCVHVS